MAGRYLHGLLGLISTISALAINGFDIQDGRTELLSNSFGNPGIDAEYDYVIVGGGNSGNVMALRLAQAQYRVALVETGTFYETLNGNWTDVPGYNTHAYHPFDNTTMLIDYDIITEPQAGYAGRQIHYSQGRTFGGSTALNYMAYHRPTVGSFQRWADTVGDQSWTWDNILPYFQRSTNWTDPNYVRTDTNPEYDLQYNQTAVDGSTGPVQLSYAYLWDYGLGLARGFESIGLNQSEGGNDGNLMGYAPFTSTINPRSATRDSSATSYLSLAMRETDLTIYPSTKAKQVLFNGTRATGVRVETQGPRRSQFTLSATREVIISAGPFHSPQLLMVSGVGPAATLQQFDIPVVHVSEGVGQNMEDQTWFGLSYHTSEQTLQPIVNEVSAYTDPAVEQYLSSQSGVLAGVGGGDMVGWEKLPAANRARLGNDTLRRLASLPDDWPELEYIPLSSAPAPADASDDDMYITVGACLTAPLSRGNVTIRSTDNDDLPIISPNWMLDVGDQEVAVQAFHRVREWVAASGIMINEYQPGDNVTSDADILRWIQTEGANLIYHASASCAMGADDNENAVLDSKARVRGVESLRVVDTSAFPFLPPGHPMSVAYMFAEKIADEIINGDS